ncbi:transcriptional regulatory protein, partial [mine drainage metagenome]
MDVDSNEKQILKLLWRHKALSRWEIHELTNNTPNQVGTDAAELIKQGLLRERIPNIAGPGRPRVPLEIDPSRRYVLGLAIRPGHVELARLNLRGDM